MHIEIIPCGWGKVELTFDRALNVGHLDDLLHDRLADIHGVEKVVVKRYSAWVEVALHITTTGKAAQRIRDMLSDDVSVTEELERTYLGAVLTVNLADSGYAAEVE